MKLKPVRQRQRDLEEFLYQQLQSVSDYLDNQAESQNHLYHSFIFIENLLYLTLRLYLE